MKTFTFALMSAALVTAAQAAPTSALIDAAKRTDDTLIERNAKYENVADRALPPPAYWIIAGHKRDINDVDTADVEVAERATDRENSVVAVSVVHALKSANNVNAYSDYIEEADPQEILGL